MRCRAPGRRSTSSLRPPKQARPTSDRRRRSTTRSSVTMRPWSAGSDACPRGPAPSATSTICCAFFAEGKQGNGRGGSRAGAVRAPPKRGSRSFGHRTGGGTISLAPLVSPTSPWEECGFPLPTIGRNGPAWIRTRDQRIMSLPRLREPPRPDETFPCLSLVLRFGAFDRIWAGLGRSLCHLLATLVGSRTRTLEQASRTSPRRDSRPAPLLGRHIAHSLRQFPLVAANVLND